MTPEYDFCEQCNTIVSKGRELCNDCHQDREENQSVAD